MHDNIPQRIKTSLLVIDLEFAIRQCLAENFVAESRHRCSAHDNIQKTDLKRIEVQRVTNSLKLLAASNPQAFLQR